MNKKIKIGFAGNTNNYPYTLALAFDKLGHDVKFVIDSDAALHRPENRFIAHAATGITVLDVSPLELEHSVRPDKEKMEQIRDFFADRDVLLLNSFFISEYRLFNRLHIPLLTGSDIDFLASDKYVDDFRAKILQKKLSPWQLRLVNVLSPVLSSGFPSTNYLYSTNKVMQAIGYAKLLNFVTAHKDLQASGIKDAVFINFFPKKQALAGDAILEKMGAGNKQRVFNLMTDVHSVPYTPKEKSEGPVRIFNVARFNWKKESAPGSFADLDFKGNDIMLRGIAMYAKDHPGIPFKLVLVRKGVNLPETYELVEELGISHLVEWKDEMSQSEVLREYGKADIIFDQLAKSLVGMGGIDAMAIGRPLIANWRPELYNDITGPWPVCQATNAAEVCEWLRVLIADPAKRAEIGRQGRAFVEDKLSSEAFARRILKALEENGILKN